MQENELKEFFDMLNETAREAGYASIYDCWEVGIKQLKNAIISLKELKKTILEIIEISNETDLQESINSIVASILITSIGLGNAPWIRKNGYMEILEIDEVLMRIGMSEFESYEGFSEILEILSDEMDVINIDIENTLEKICRKVRRIVGLYEDLADFDYSMDDCLEVLNLADDITGNIIEFYKIYLHNIRTIQREAILYS